MVREGFFASPGGFTAISGHNLSPPGVIADVAKSRVVRGAELQLPEGYDADTLDRIYWRVGYRDKPVGVSVRQAKELEFIGRQLLQLDENHMIDAPLNRLEKEGIVELIRLVDEIAQTPSVPSLTVEN